MEHRPFRLTLPHLLLETTQVFASELLEILQGLTGLEGANVVARIRGSPGWWMPRLCDGSDEAGVDAETITVRPWLVTHGASGTRIVDTRQGFLATATQQVHKVLISLHAYIHASRCDPTDHP